MTVKEFLLKKYPPKDWMDCPVPMQHWGIIQEYAERYHEEQSAKPGIMREFGTKEELQKHITDNMPFAVKPVKKAKTTYVAPFTSNHARIICIDAMIDCLLKKKAGA